jgi:hypothetical protein
MRYDYKIYFNNNLVMQGTTAGKVATRTRHEQSEWLKIQAGKQGYNSLKGDFHLYMKAVEK